MPFNRILSASFRRYWRFSRGLLFAVSGAVVDAEARILLVRSDAAAPWRLPGGVVEKGEDVEHALARSLAGTGIELTGRPEPFAIYAHPGSRRTHIALLVARAWRQGSDASATSGATTLHAFFPAIGLPTRIDDAVAIRIAEITGRSAPSETW